MEVKDVPTSWINSNRAYPRKANRGNEAKSGKKSCENLSPAREKKKLSFICNITFRAKI